MGLFCRTNLALCPLLNYSYCTFNNNMTRLKVPNTSSAKSIGQHEAKLAHKLKHRKDHNTNLGASGMTFDSMINYRQAQAHRSILVQVNSVNSYQALQQLCYKYGDIISMHHYKTKDTQDFMLIEFKSPIAVRDIISSASFMDVNSVAPMKTSTLWFHSTKKLQMGYSTKQLLPLSVINGCHIPSEAEIIQDLIKAQSVSDQMVTLHNVLRLTDLEIRLRFYTAYQLQQCFSGIFPDVSVLPFGSSVNGFGKRGCDLDLVLLLNNKKHKGIYDAPNSLVFHAKQIQFDKKYEKKEFMSIMADMLKHFVPGIHKVNKILEARVPIIKFNHMYTSIECDLCVGNRAGVYMSELLCIFGEIDDRVRPLIFVIRTWAQKHRVTNSNPGKWITNFSLTLLVLFYLQTKKVLPSMNTLKLHATHEDIRTDTGVDCTFLRNIKQLRCLPENTESLEALLHGFFVYYSNFDYETHAISLRDGYTVRKKDSSPLLINNPFEPSLNVSPNVNLAELQHIVLVIRETLAGFQFDDRGIMPLLGLKVPPRSVITSMGAVNVSKIYDKTTKKQQSAKNLNENPNTLETSKTTEKDLSSDNSSDNDSVSTKQEMKQESV